MPSKGGSRKDAWVFLNVPFDKPYEPLFVALVAGLVGLGRVPKCALEAKRVGSPRLDGILQLIGDCPASIHDLSRMPHPGKALPRMNMAFELGVSVGIDRSRSRRATQRHAFFLFESRRHRVGKTLSDMAAYDPEVHGDRPHRVLACILNCFSRVGKTPSIDELKRLYDKLWPMADALRRQFGAKSLFERHLYRQVVTTATKLAVRQKLLRST